MGWISVNGYKEVPMGNWLVKLESSSRDCDKHVMVRHPNITIIGNHFSFDMDEVIAYHSLPED